MSPLTMRMVISAAPSTCDQKRSLVPANGDVGPEDEEAWSHTIVICCRSSLAKRLFGMKRVDTPHDATTCVTRKLTRMLHKAYASSR